MQDDDALRQRQIGFETTPKYHAEVERAALLLEPVPEGPLLDVGCGPGLGTGLLRRATSRTVVGIDPSTASGAGWDELAHASVFGLAESMPFHDGSFAGAAMLHSIGHVDSVSRALREVYRVLAPEGRVVIVTPNALFVRQMRLLNTLRLLRHEPDPTVLRYLDGNHLRSAMEEAGFTATVETWGQPSIPAKLLTRFLSDRYRERVVGVGLKGA